MQCSACEHTFTVYGPDAGKADDEPRTDPGRQAPAPPPPPPPTPPRAPAAARPPPPPLSRSRSGSLFLAQGDRIYKVKDVATLQRWIVEKRVLPNDRVSLDGKSWDVVSERADLRAFFAIIDQLKSAKRELRKQRTSGELGRADRSEEDTHGPRDALDRTDTVRETAPGAEGVVTPAGAAATGEAPPRAYGSGIVTPPPSEPPARPTDSLPEHGMAPPAALTPTASQSTPLGASQSIPPAASQHIPVGASQSMPPAASASSPLLDPPAPSRSQQAMSSPGMPGPAPEGVVGSDSFFGEVAAPVGPFDSGEVATSDNLKETRNVPVQRPTSPPQEVQPAGAATPTGPSRSVSDSDIAIKMVNPSDDFDPDQTFEDDFYRRPSGRGFYLLLLLLFVAIGAGLYYFLMGPGRGDPYADAPRAEATPTPAAEPSPEPTAEAIADAEGEPSPAATPEPTPEPTPAATPKAQQTPTPTSTPKARPAARPTPKPTASRRVDHMKAAEAARGRGKYADAATSYAEALAADPKNFRAALQLGWMNVELGRNPAGIAAFNKALALRSSSAEAHYGLGLAYQARGQVQQAITHYERVVELDPDGRDTREVKAILRQLKP